MMLELEFTYFSIKKKGKKICWMNIQIGRCPNQAQVRADFNQPIIEQLEENNVKTWGRKNGIWSHLTGSPSEVFFKMGCKEYTYYSSLLPSVVYGSSETALSVPAEVWKLREILGKENFF